MKPPRFMRAVAVAASLLLPIVVCQDVRASEDMRTGQNVRASEHTSASQDALAGEPLAAASSDSGSNPFDSLYKSNFRLTSLSADQIAPASKPTVANDLAGAAHIDPSYGTRVYRATDASTGESGPLRHDHSRRQAFNADNSRYIARDGSGAWYLYDARTFTMVKKLDALSGDCEPIWHQSDPDKLYFTSDGGGPTWWTLDVSTGSTTVLADFKGMTPWPEADAYWTGGEGTMSANGRYLGLMAVRRGSNGQPDEICGLVTFDIKEKKIVGSLDADDFPVSGAMPEYVSTSASGKYVVASWSEGRGGTHAYSRNFRTSAKLAKGSASADLAFGPDRQDYYVYADETGGKIVAVDLATRKRITLHTLTPASGETYSLDISGQAFDRPGWVVVSTYADSAEDGKVSPSPTVRAEYRKVWLLKLEPNGRALNVAHIHTGEAAASGGADGSGDGDAAGDGGNAGGLAAIEPRATASRDLSRIMFASNFGQGEVESYLVGLPSKFAGR